MDRWEGKVAVVTGASTGIGAATCLRLAEKGLRVVGLARRPALVDELQAQVQGSGSIVSRQCDVTSVDEVAETFRWLEEELGGVDVLVNNAGVYHAGHITNVQGKQISDELLHSTLETNVRAVWVCTRHAVASMCARAAAGHILTVNSITGHYIPINDMFNVYASSKYAVTAFLSSLRAELAGARSLIKVTDISPGLVDTPMTSAAKAMGLPMLEPDNVADTVIYALGTPPSVNIPLIHVQPLHEVWL